MQARLGETAFEAKEKTKAQKEGERGKQAQDVQGSA